MHRQVRKDSARLLQPDDVFGQQRLCQSNAPKSSCASAAKESKRKWSWPSPNPGCIEGEDNCHGVKISYCDFVLVLVLVGILLVIFSKLKKNGSLLVNSYLWWPDRLLNKPIPIRNIRHNKRNIRHSSYWSKIRLDQNWVQKDWKLQPEIGRPISGTKIDEPIKIARVKHRTRPFETQSVTETETGSKILFVAGT